MNIRTKLAQAGIIEDEAVNAISAPIYPSTTFIRREGRDIKYEYSRTANPTRTLLEETIAEFEHGAGGCAFASGMAAITAVISLFRKGDRIIVSDDLYGGTYRLFQDVFAHQGITATYLATSRIEELERSIDETVKAVFIETPSNPMMKITDIKEVAALANERNIKCIVDNTFMTPYLQKPIVLGADIVIHSGTKYLGGHNDALCGIVVCASKEDAERVAFVQNATGGVLSPFDSWLVLRGMKTLAVRLDRAQSNADKIASWMMKQNEISDIYYPGVISSPAKEIHEKQALGYGAMLSFRLKDTAIVERIIKKCRVIRYAESLGGVETLITRPSTQTHTAMPPELRERLGITDTLLRISVGIEDYTDLINDLSHAIGGKNEI